MGGKETTSLLEGPKGGGFQDTKSWNLALKVLWNIHDKKDTLWIQWINAIYLKGGVDAEKTLPFSKRLLISETH